MILGTRQCSFPWGYLPAGSVDTLRLWPVRKSQSTLLGDSNIITFIVPLKFQWFRGFILFWLIQALLRFTEGIFRASFLTYFCFFFVRETSEWQKHIRGNDFPSIINWSTTFSSFSFISELPPNQAMVGSTWSWQNWSKPRMIFHDLEKSRQSWMVMARFPWPSGWQSCNGSSWSFHEFNDNIHSFEFLR